MKIAFLHSVFSGFPLFDLFYLGAILITALIVGYSGIRRGYPKSSWGLLLLIGLQFFFIGEKLAFWSVEQWDQFIREFSVAKAGGMTLLGGFTGLIAGLVLASYWLKFRHSVLDLFAIALPMAIAVSRLGCLTAGCCHGTLTALPWGIRYGPGFEVYTEQLSLGLIQPGAAASLPIHPVQLYETLGCLVIACMVWLHRKRWSAGGNLFLFFLSAYALLRFIDEFFREAVIGRRSWHGLTIVQWIMLAVMVILPFIIYLREKYATGKHPDPKVYFISFRRKGTLAAFFFIVLIAFREVFTLAETGFMLAVFILLVVFLVIEGVRAAIASEYRWVLPVLLVGSVVMMSQNDQKTAADESEKSFTTIGLTGMFGRYTEEMLYVENTWNGSCDNGQWSEFAIDLGKTGRKFYQGAFDIYYSKWKGKYRKMRVGGQIFLSGESGGMKASYPPGTSFAITPWYSYDWRWLGLTTGLHMGSMKMPIGKSGQVFQGDTISKVYRTGFIWPAFEVRVGPYDLVYLKVGLEPTFPSFSPFSTGGTFCLGSGLGRTDGTSAEIGIFADNIFFARFFLPINDKFTVDALIGDNFSSGVSSERVVRIGLGFRIPSTK